MKIVAILEDTIDAGGEYNQSLNAISQMARICNGLFDFEVFTIHSENIKYLDELGVRSVLFKYTVVDKLISLSSSSPVLKLVLNRCGITGSFESKLCSHGTDLVYFTSHTSSSNKLQNLNYITTVVDLCHRDSPEFPEVRNSGDFYWREHHLINNLAPALTILTASDSLSDLISSRYGIDKDRLLAMPFSPAPFLQGPSAEDKCTVLKTYGLDEGFFFYPAQFWAHKNHICILAALLILRNQGLEYKVVFAGGDKGNRSHIERFVAHNSLESQVRFLGFVPAEHMRGLYEGCVAVTMPTYFGPTNLPPLEAWMIGKPLIYSSHMIDEVGDAAICVNPDEPGELAEVMIACNDSNIHARLVKAGHLRLQEIEKQRGVAEIKLRKILLQFSVRRRCWE